MENRIGTVDTRLYNNHKKIQATQQKARQKQEKEAKENAKPKINKSSQKYAQKFQKENETLVDRLMTHGKRIEQKRQEKVDKYQEP